MYNFRKYMVILYAYIEPDNLIIIPIIHSIPWNKLCIGDSWGQFFMLLEIVG